jgi:hypothetical protein
VVHLVLLCCFPADISSMDHRHRPVKILDRTVR